VLGHDQIVLTIAELYEDKLRSDAAADLAESQRPAWAQFVYIWMMQRHLAKSRAMSALGALLDGVVRGAAESPRLRLFCQLCGLSMSHQQPTRSAVDAVTEMVGALFPGEVRERLLATEGSLRVPLHDSGSKMSATEAVGLVRDKLTRTYSRRILKACEAAANEQRLVDVDRLLLSVFEALEDAAAKLHAGLHQLLLRYDENGDGVLSLREFGTMCARLNREASDDEVQALFMEVQEASEEIDANVGDAIHPKAFAQVMQGTPFLVDTEGFLSFLREMRLMPQEDE